MATWPTADSFPQTPLMEGNSKTLPNTIIRTPMDVGPDKLRQRSTVDDSKHHYNFHMMSTNIVALNTFYLSTCNGGASSFEWVDPDTSNTEDWRFLSPPTWVQLKNNLYHVSISLEQLP